MRDFIEIKKDLIPYSFNILLGGNWFELHIDYNKTADMFTVALSKDEAVLAVEPLVLGVPLFSQTWQPGFPAVDIVPYGTTETIDRITWENLGVDVFLTVDDEGGGV